MSVPAIGQHERLYACVCGHLSDAHFDYPISGCVLCVCVMPLAGLPLDGSPVCDLGRGSDSLERIEDEGEADRVVEAGLEDAAPASGYFRDRAARRCERKRALLVVVAVRHDMALAICSVVHPSPYFAHGELGRELVPLRGRLELVAQGRPELLEVLGWHFGVFPDLEHIWGAVTERAGALLDRRLNVRAR